jgi:hypothetical protein
VVVLPVVVLPVNNLHKVDNLLPDKNLRNHKVDNLLPDNNLHKVVQK